MMIESVDDLIDSIHNTVPKGIWAFRGQVNHTWLMLPSLLRMARYNAIVSQRALVNQFLLRKFEFPFLRNNDPVDYLMLLQHFGVPTKLLDVTFDPFVGLFFACYDPSGNNANVDGKLCIIPVSQFDKLEINTPNQDVYNKPITEDGVRELWDRVSPEKHLFFEPMYKNARMRAQDGCFVLFSMRPEAEGDKFVSLERFLELKNQFLDTNELNKEKSGRHWYGYKRIPASAKSHILNELNDRFGIGPNTLFPETPYLQSVESFVRKVQAKASADHEGVKKLIPKHYKSLPF